MVEEGLFFFLTWLWSIHTSCTLTETQINEPDLHMSSFASHLLNSFWKVQAFLWTAVVSRIPLVLIRTLFSQLHACTNATFQPQLDEHRLIVQSNRTVMSAAKEREQGERQQHTNASNVISPCALYPVSSCGIPRVTHIATYEDTPTPLSVFSLLYIITTLTQVSYPCTAYSHK